MTENDAQQELAFIKKVMEDSRRIIAYDGKDFTVWGILVAVGMILMYLKIVFQFQIDSMIFWGILIGTGWLFSIKRRFTHYRKRRVKTFAGAVIGSVWLSCGIVMTLIGFVLGPVGAIKGWAIMPLIALVLGIGYFITSVIIPNRWIRYSAFGWWIGGILIAAYPAPYILLVFAGMMICFQIIPGIVLQRQYRKQFDKVSHD